jgi:MbtH protein
MRESKMSNLFDAPDGKFFVLVNHEGQHSLWPAGIAAPNGWSTVLQDSSRQDCLDYIREHWTDMRPASLIEELANNAK